VEQFTGYYKTAHQLRTVEATSEDTFIHGLEIAVHCDLITVRCTNTLTYLLKGTLRRCVCGDDAALRQITVAIYRCNRP